MKKSKLIEEMQEKYSQWLEAQNEEPENDEIEEKLEEIAEEYDYSLKKKLDLLCIYKKESGNLIVAWHNDHDRDWGIESTGFDDYDNIDREYLFEPGRYYCLNCQYPLDFEVDEDVITCPLCHWRNDLAEDPAADITPIVVKTKTFKDLSSQVCYPLIEEKDLKEIPEALRLAIMHYFKDPDHYEKKDYDNIYVNLYRKDSTKFKQLAVKYLNKYKLSVFFKNTNFLK